MRKRMFALVLCLIMALALVPAAVYATETGHREHIYASIGEKVNFSCRVSSSASIAGSDALALRELGLSGSVSGKRLTVSGTAEKAGQARLHVGDVVLKVRVSVPETPPKTGDENMPLLFSALAILSLAGLAVMIRKARS